MRQMCCDSGSQVVVMTMKTLECTGCQKVKENNCSNFLLYRGKEKRAPKWGEIRLCLTKIGQGAFNLNA